MNHQTARLECILAEAVEIEADADRQAFVLKACAGNDVLRAQIDELITNFFRAGSFLERPAAVVQTAATLLHQERAGTRIGPFKLLEQIGEGGMGLVFVAEQLHPVRREVALKLIKPGMDSIQVVARFEAERQALALMDHPNIAKVLEAGTTENGRPYFVMELVRGIPITAYCDQARFTIRQRLEVFVQVCRAVQHAHTKGVIHRDLKPSNVLVTSHDGVPVPLVIDFGVAKALGRQLTERTLHTAFAQMIGTPTYMSPEQAEFNQLGVDTRSDIYSLGVLLYELLTGTTPFPHERLRTLDHDELRRVLRDEVPPRPSVQLNTPDADPTTASQRRGVDARKLTNMLHGELDWIVLKALEKDRTRRYETASAFATDIERYLNFETVEACPPSVAYQLRRLARRNRRLLATSGLIALILITATIVSVWQAVRAKCAQHQAEFDRDQSSASEQKATAISDFLQRDLLRQASSDNQKVDGYAKDPNLTVKEALDRASSKIGERFQQQPLVEAALRHTIGNAYTELGERPPAAEHLQRAVELRSQHLGLDHPDTLQSQYSYAMSMQWIRQADAIAMLEAVLEKMRTTFGPDALETLVTLNSLGNACRKNGELERARQLVREALTRKTAAIGPAHPSTVNSLHDLGLIYRDLGHYDESITMLKEATEKLESLRGVDYSDTIYSRSNLIEVYEKAGKRAEACQVLRDVIERWSNADELDKHPDRLQFAIELRLLLSEKLLRQGKTSEGVALLRSSLNLCEKLGDQLWLVRVNILLAESLIALKDYAAAESIFRYWLQGPERAFQPRWQRYRVMSLLGAALATQGKWNEAEPFLIGGYEGLARPRNSATPAWQSAHDAAFTNLEHFYKSTSATEKLRRLREQEAKAKPAK